MKIIDANIVLRYLLKDDQLLFDKSVNIIEKTESFIPTPIVAEIVYVLEKVYNIPKNEIHLALNDLFESRLIVLEDKNFIIFALSAYHKYNLDFADSILLSYKQTLNFEVITFDKKLNKLLN
ncbi:MAG: PIN domain-containing protein [Ignavibacteriae bacterium]|nr:PIN domain-containing protein [Ignavibacteriota bacterium]